MSNNTLMLDTSLSIKDSRPFIHFTFNLLEFMIVIGVYFMQWQRKSKIFNSDDIKFEKSFDYVVYSQ
ncbi:hypothetical protein VCHA29O37_360033 [Vibrio chagasii]|nr:hypothetical protein VCHA29O37_360033 [Vibrio chagasii]